jgi:GNAT superfamily N-acetyltransferase
MIRKIKPSDRQALENILRSISQFNNGDVDVALELIDIAINIPGQTDYHLFVYEEEGVVYGYHCTGKRPITDAVYDLYWIVVDAKTARKGVGSALLKHAEDFVKQQNGRWLLAETSSKESYDKTRRFYLKNEYSILAEINDFYSLGEALVIYGKYFLNK